MTTNLIAITYTVIANPRGGWLPVYSVNGHRHGNEWAVHGYDKDEALAMARAEAEETASRFIGDWVVRVERLMQGDGFLTVATAEPARVG